MNKVNRKAIQVSGGQSIEFMYKKHVPQSCDEWKRHMSLYSEGPRSGAHRLLRSPRQLKPAKVGACVRISSPRAGDLHYPRGEKLLVDLWLLVVLRALTLGDSTFCIKPCVSTKLVGLRSPAAGKYIASMATGGHELLDNVAGNITALVNVMKSFINSNSQNSLPQPFMTWAETGGKPITHSDLMRWMNTCQINPIIALSMYYVAKTEPKKQGAGLGNTFLGLMYSINHSNDLAKNGTDLLNKICSYARMIKARKPQIREVVIPLLCSEEIFDRMSDFHDDLAAAYRPNPIRVENSVREIRDRVISLSDDGHRMYNKNIPPEGTWPWKTRDIDHNEFMNANYMDNAINPAMGFTVTDAETCDHLCKVMDRQSHSLAHALRSFNSDHSNEKKMLITDVMEDMMLQDHSLGRERCAAISHMEAMLAANQCAYGYFVALDNRRESHGLMEMEAQAYKSIVLMMNRIRLRWPLDDDVFIHVWVSCLWS